MEPIPMDITKAEFEKETGIREQEKKGVKINDTSKIVSEALANVVNFSLREKETESAKIVSFGEGDFSRMALSKIMKLPLKTAKGTVDLNPSDPILKAKMHCLVAIKLQEILTEIRDNCDPKKKALLDNSLEILELSIDKNFDGVDILESLKINGPISSQEVDKAVAKILEKPFNQTDIPEKGTEKAQGIIEEHLKSPQAMMKFINTYVVDKTKFLIKALGEGHFQKATRLFTSMPHSERLELGKTLAGKLTSNQITQFSLALDQEASRHHSDSEVPVGESPKTFWKELEADRAALFKMLKK